MLKKLLKNSASNVTLLLVKLCMTFIMSPIIVRALGNYDYGIWEIIFSIVGYMGLLDLGIKTAVIYYVAKYNATKDRKKLHKLFSTSLFFMGLVGIFSFLFFLLWAFVKPELLAETGYSHTKYVFLLIIIGIQLLFSFPGYVAESFHEGFQQHVLKNSITLINTLIGASILFVLLQRGYGLLTLALINATGVSVKYTIYLLLLRSPERGGFRLSKKDISKTSLKELLVFGYKNVIRSVAAMIANCTDSIVIGMFLGPAVVVYYAIPSKLITYIRNIVWSATTPFMPIFSDLNAREEKSKSAELLIASSKYVVGIVLPVFGVLFLLGVPFLRRWMGPEYSDNGKWVLYILIGGYGFGLLNPFSSNFLVGIGRHGMLAKIRSAIAVSNLVLSLILVQFFGKEGVAFGTLLPIVIFEPVILHITCQHLGITVRRYVSDVFLPLIIPNILFVLVLWRFSCFVGVDTYFNILVVIFMSALVYSFFFFLFSVGKDEREFVLCKLREKMSRSI